MQQHGLALSYASRAQRCDLKTVLLATTQRGDALQFAGEELAASNRLALAVVQRAGGAGAGAAGGAAVDVEEAGAAGAGEEAGAAGAGEEAGAGAGAGAGAATESSTAILERYAAAAKKKSDDDEGATKRTAAVFARLGQRFRNDAEVAAAAINGSRGAALMYASESLRNDRDLVLRAVRRSGDGAVLQFASP